MKAELNKSMTRRERVLEAIRHHETDIVPYQIDLTSAAYTRLMGLVKDPEYLQRMGNHIVQGAYDMFVGETVPGSGFWRDDFGVVWNRTSIDTDIGFVEGIVLHESSLSGFHPELDEARLRQGLEQALAAVEDECRVVDVGWGLFERGWTLRGMENLLVDMIAEPKFVEALFESLCDHQMRVIDIALEYPFDLVLFGDDWGGQMGLILGKKHWQRYLKPHFARMFEKVKNAGKFIALHSCGNIEALFPYLIDIGLDVYQTFQPEIYDIQAVKRKYGKDLAFWGGISTQRVLPFGTSEDVKRVTRETIKILGPDGGYIIGPTHAIPGDTPPENIVALVETCWEQIL